MGDPLKPFPEKPDYHEFPEPTTGDWNKYHALMAEAYAQRLRVAVGALKSIENDCAVNEWLSSLVMAAQALQAIGDMPAWEDQ